MVIKMPDRSEPEVNGNGDLANSRNPGILIADEMGLNLALLKFELEPRGFAVWLAMDSEGALELYRQHRERIDLVLLSVRMSGLDGPHTLAALQGLDPDVLVCFMTAEGSTYKEDDLLKRGAAFVFNKSFRLPEVAHFLEMLVGNGVNTPAPDRSARRMQAPA